jgi:hypothetical protein
MADPARSVERTYLAGISALALPLLLARCEKAVSDPIERDADASTPGAVPPLAPGHVPLDGD